MINSFEHKRRPLLFSALFSILVSGCTAETKNDLVIHTFDQDGHEIPAIIKFSENAATHVSVTALAGGGVEVSWNGPTPTPVTINSDGGFKPQVTTVSSGKLKIILSK